MLPDENGRLSKDFRNSTTLKKYLFEYKEPEKIYGKFTDMTAK